MICSVHGYYKKQGGKKAPMKIEAIVFASDEDKAEDLVRQLFSGYPADIEYLNTISNTRDNEETISNQRPELRGISPDTGYIYNKLYHRKIISKYFS